MNCPVCQDIVDLSCLKNYRFFKHFDIDDREDWCGRKIRTCLKCIPTCLICDGNLIGEIRFKSDTEWICKECVEKKLPFIDELHIHFHYRPGGQGYWDALESFNCCQSQLKIDLFS